jgi:hypothetical protein
MLLTGLALGRIWGAGVLDPFVIAVALLAVSVYLIAPAVRLRRR